MSGLVVRSHATLSTGRQNCAHEQTKTKLFDKVFISQLIQSQGKPNVIGICFYMPNRLVSPANQKKTFSCRMCILLTESLACVRGAQRSVAQAYVIRELFARKPTFIIV